VYCHTVHASHSLLSHSLAPTTTARYQNVHRTAMPNDQTPSTHWFTSSCYVGDMPHDIPVHLSISTTITYIGKSIKAPKISPRTFLIHHNQPLTTLKYQAYQGKQYNIQIINRKHRTSNKRHVSTTSIASLHMRRIWNP
jgi:hypothetical protein